MDVFNLRTKQIGDHRPFTSGFVDVREQRLGDHVPSQPEMGNQSPAPWISLNASFAIDGTISAFVAAGVLDAEGERMRSEGTP